MKKSILTRLHASQVARFVTRTAYWIALAAIPILALGAAPFAAAQTTIQVTTTQQGVTDPSHCSLQEAIYAAEFASNTAVKFTDPDAFYTTGCQLQGSTPPYTIVLQKTVYSFTTSWDHDAHNPFGPTATPIIFTPVTIQGNGATLQWTGTGKSRLFAIGSASVFDSLDNKPVSGTGALTLDSVYIKGFKTKGGDGVCGGGGGLGAGGAIYVGMIDSGVPSLTVQNSTFDSNFAIGGNGGGEAVFCFNNSESSGGGGGLSGSGGGGGDGGGGGGGARGDGGLGYNRDTFETLGGGGGGGTIFDGANSTPTSGSGGYLCGGSGGGHENAGHNATCPGGGGGGGGRNDSTFDPTTSSDGAPGAYGGGGGGAGLDIGHFTGGSGGNGGFGGGGGASGGSRSLLTGTHGGNGGFGGGAGFGIGTEVDSNGAPGFPGRFGGRGDGHCCGGGGGALGGAIFNQGGTVVVRNSTFTHNDVDRGEGGVGNGGSGSNGGDSGAAIFSVNGSLTLENATISDNFATGAGGGVVVVADPLGAPVSVTAPFRLFNTIISRNGARECIVAGASQPNPDPFLPPLVSTVDASGSGNLILDNDGCPGVAVAVDPQLAALAVDPHSRTGTPTLALPAASAAVDAGDDSHILATDQRGISRPQGPHTDIGAFEVAPPSANLALTSQASASQIVAGGSFTYTVQLSNAGPDDAADVAFRDTAPAGVTFNSCTSMLGACSVSGGEASLDLGTLPNGATVTITIQATLGTSATDGANLVNTPSVTSSTSDPDPTNNTGSAASATITVQNRSDLSVTTQSSTDVINFGGTLVYTVTVTNQGPFQASAVTLVDSLDPHALYLSKNTGGASCTTPPLAQSGTIQCSFGNLASGASATVSFTVRISVQPLPASVTNTVIVSSPNFDPNPINNSASVRTLVFGHIRL